MNWVPVMVVSLSVFISLSGIPGRAEEPVEPPLAKAAEPPPAKAAEPPPPEPPSNAAGGGSGPRDATVSPGHSASVQVPCPAQCRKINRFTCGDWIDRADGSNNTIWNWNGRYCALTTERRSWMLSQNCVPFDSQKERIFWSKNDCKNTCKPCIK